MAAAIKLMRIGKRGKPNYRIVIIDRRKKRSGSYLEKIGFYNPLTNPPQLELNKERLEYWTGKGAIASEGVVKLLKRV